MKFRMYGMVLSLFFALGLVFSFGIETSADHGSMGIAAGDVDPTVEAEVEAFLDHIIDYYDQVVADNTGDTAALNRGVVIYGRALRQEGAYKHSATNMYSMGINAREIVTNHARYPNLFGYEFDSAATGSAVASTIQALIDDSGVGMTHCEEDYDGQGRVACATKVSSPTGDITVIAGLHHAENDSAFVLPDCTEFTLAPNAEDVFDDPTDANLEAYVKGVINVSQQVIADATVDELQEFMAGGGMLTDLAIDPTKLPELLTGVNARLYDKAACFGSGDFKHENIYAFIMGADLTTSTVLFNGNNFDLNGANLELNDNQLSGEQNIARLFDNELGGGAVGNFAYVDYHWDDPTDPNDDVPNFFETNSVPGTSPKRSYIEVADLNAKTAQAIADLTGFPASVIQSFFEPTPYVFGSGTYPEEEMMPEEMMPEEMMPEEMMPEEMMPEEMMPEEMMPEEMMPEEEVVVGDGACAIARTGHTSQGALLNLFLIASVLFSVVFLRRRV